MRRMSVAGFIDSNVHGALDLQQTRSLSFYDALIMQAAIVSGCSVLYSEDMKAGEVVHGVKIVNPFL